MNIESIIANPISFKDLNYLLSKNTLRSEFISKYEFFKEDGHFKIYQSFIDATSFISKNNRIEDAICLADSIDYYSERLILLIQEILFSKKNYFLKLTCMDYLLSQREKIDSTIFEELNFRYINNTNAFLKLQSNINLLNTQWNIEARVNIKKVLKSAPFPNIFYRFFNAIKFNIFLIEHIEIVQLLYEVNRIATSNGYSNEVVNEINRIANDIIGRGINDI